MFVSLMFFVWIFFNIMKFKGDGKVKVTWGRAVAQVLVNKCPFLPSRIA
jgi:hypothetical protein